MPGMITVTMLNISFCDFKAHGHFKWHLALDKHTNAFSESPPPIHVQLLELLEVYVFECESTQCKLSSCTDIWSTDSNSELTNNYKIKCVVTNILVNVSMVLGRNFISGILKPLENIILLSTLNDSKSSLYTTLGIFFWFPFLSI